MDQAPFHFLEDRLSARLLKVYAYYRLFLAILLLAMYFSGFASQILGASSPSLFEIVALAYAGLALLTLALASQRRYIPGPASLFFVLLSDVVAYTLLMNASGGLPSGLGFLMLVTVAAGSIFFTGQLAISLAAVASICIILESLAASNFIQGEPENIFPAGVLGILLFLTALIFQFLNRGLRQAQETADREAEYSARLQQLNELIVRRMQTGIIVVDTHDQIELINRSAVQLLGGHLPGVPLSPGQHLRVAPELYQRLERWRTYPWMRTETFVASGCESEVQANFADLEQRGERRTLIFLEDIRTTAQQAQQLKLASLGRLTGSIAHEIRNPLGAISHASQLLAEQALQAPEFQRLSNIIENHTIRVNQIVENVLQLSRQKAPKLQKINLRNWLKKFVEDYSAGCNDQCEIHQVFVASDVQVVFDPGHLQQILTNLLSNAIYYSRENSSTPWAELRIYVDTATDLPVIDIRDKGPGISADDRERLFEPFFTTSREGTGLGLYIARELCEINYATLNYVSTAGDSEGFFRIGFAHPERLLPRIDNGN